MAAIKLRQIKECDKVGDSFVRQGICTQGLGCITIQLADYGNGMDVA